jgi:YggT family protein
MFLIANLLIALAQLSGIVIDAVLFLILVRCLCSWFSPDGFNPVISLIYRVTDPILRPMQRILSAYKGGVEAAPMVLGLGLFLLKQLVRYLCFAGAGMLQ